LIKQQFSEIPELTSTLEYIASTRPTITLLPLTSTLESFPSLTVTRTPRPTATKTLAPAWVTNFAEPIIKDIQSREPDFQDGFEKKSNFWEPSEWCVSRVKFDNGVMRMTDCHVNWTRNYDDFAASFDLRISGDQQFKFYIRRTSSFPGCNFGFQGYGTIFWECSYPDPKNQVKELANNIYDKKILIIAVGNQFALYVNESPITLIEADILKFGECWLAGSGQIDNFKLWKLDKANY
jgi:hypothetical protein